MIDASILDKVRRLPPEKQQEVADFVNFLSRQSVASGQRPRLKGLCADLGVQITEEDIDHVRREIWGGFPREDV
ncbi:MAG: DUF2281 domain-containing protein [Thermoguttaceae bacterium]|jgi:hypothetical protein